MGLAKFNCTFILSHYTAAHGEFHWIKYGTYWAKKQWLYSCIFSYDFENVTYKWELWESEFRAITDRLDQRFYGLLFM